MIPFLSSLSLVELNNNQRDYNVTYDKALITQLSLSEVFKNYNQIKDNNNLVEVVSLEKIPENQLLNLSYKFIRKHITE